MRIFGTFLIALRALRRNKLRSILTALGIIIGVAAVIVVVGLGSGAKAQIEAQVASLGQNIVSVFPGSMTSGGMRGGWGSASSLTVEDSEAIAREITGIVAVSPDVRDRQQILADGLNWNTQIQGASPEFISIRTWAIAEGDNFTELDVRGATKVCVIGKTVADQLFPAGDAVGKSLRIRNLPFKVLGVLMPKGFNMFGQDQDDTVIVPYTSAMKRVSRRDRLSSISIQAESPDVMAKVQQDVTELLTQRRQGREPDFTVRNQLELVTAQQQASETMRTLLLAVAGVSLFVGGIGIMNIMLVSVTERTREIGIRAAVGAKSGDVLIQFLIEAVVLSVLGGVLGILLAAGVGELVRVYLKWSVLIPWWVIAASFTGAGIVGVIFGFFPAFKAARMDPIEALRFE